MITTFVYRQALEDVSKNLGYAKTMLFGSAEQEAQSDYQLATLAQEMYNTNLLSLLISNLGKIDFEVSGPSRLCWPVAGVGDGRILWS